MKPQCLTFAAYLLTELIAGHLLETPCIGYTDTIGRESAQVTDDIVSALRFQKLIEDNPGFDFDLALLSNVKYVTPIGVPDNHTPVLFT